MQNVRLYQDEIIQLDQKIAELNTRKEELIGAHVIKTDAIFQLEDLLQSIKDCNRVQHFTIKAVNGSTCGRLSIEVRIQYKV